MSVLYDELFNEFDCVFSCFLLEWVEVGGLVVLELVIVIV